MKTDVAATVVVKGDKFLILKRSKFCSNPGFWNFPGGSIEDNESPEESAVRELKEEADLGANPDDLEYIGLLSSKKLRVRFFITDIFNGEVSINRESDEFKWITLDDLDQYLFVGGGSLNENIIKAISKFIGE